MTGFIIETNAKDTIKYLKKLADQMANDSYWYLEADGLLEAIGELEFLLGEENDSA